MLPGSRLLPLQVLLLLLCSFFFIKVHFELNLPRAGRTACPARELAANKTAPPPMIPKLLTAKKQRDFIKSQVSVNTSRAVILAGGKLRKS